MLNPEQSARQDPQMRPGVFLRVSRHIRPESVGERGGVGGRVKDRKRGFLLCVSNTGNLFPGPDEKIY